MSSSTPPKPHPPIRVRDRSTGELFEERVFGESALHFLYHTPRGRLVANLVLSRPLVNRAYGWWQRSPGSRKKIREFVDSLGIDVDEADRPLEQFRSLDDFFTRKLRPDARPIDPEPDHLVAPADGRVLAFPRLDRQRLNIKGSSTTLAELAGDDALAARYRGGAALVVRLAPADYHRFHFPASGVATKEIVRGRTLHSVHPIALSGRAPSFRNKRAICRLATETFGELLMIEVGAMLVGTIEQTYRPGPVVRGQEKGMFRFGGSTVIVVAEPDALTLDADLVESSADGLESFVRMGTRVAVTTTRP